MPAPLHLRVFISSPGDVADERNLARYLLKDELPFEPFLRGRVTLDPVSWDDPAAPTPMVATSTPQEAVNRFGCRPSECDIVIVILWSRIGTHLDLSKFRKPDGEPYLSGTEYEYEDAAGAEKPPIILVYRRTDRVFFDADDPKHDANMAQRRKALAFFERFKNPDGSCWGGVTEYATPTDFVGRLAKDLRTILQEKLEAAAPSSLPAVVVEPAWTGSPYPGLRPFDITEEAIFFGRGRETDALIARLRDPNQRFLVVVGASGSGKSSLVRAGLLPRLRQGAIEGSRHWCTLLFTPGAAGGNPFLALAFELFHKLPPSTRKPPISIAEELAKEPQRVTEYAVVLLAGSSNQSALVLFVDQMEELFTPSATTHRTAFLDLLASAAGDPRLRVIATLRTDFLSQAVAESALRPHLQSAAGAGTYPLVAPDPLALAEMIRRPAERAGLEIEDDVVHEIVKDAGTDPGALPLVAFCLEELYRSSAPAHRLTAPAYNALGRLHGAIGRRANVLLSDLRKTEGVALEAALPTLFQALVHVDAAGSVTRRRTFRDELATDPQLARLIETLVQVPGRLLQAGNAGGRATITLAHEALLTAWPTLSEWVEANRTELQRFHRLLLSLTSDNPLEDRLYAAKALSTLGTVTPEAVPTLIAALADADEDVRRAAANALGKIGPAAPEAVPTLIAALADAHGSVRRAAANALGKIGPAAVSALIAALADADEDVRWTAADALGKIGPAAADAVSALIEASLRDTAFSVRQTSAEALREIGPAAADAVSALIEASLRDTAFSVLWLEDALKTTSGPQWLLREVRYDPIRESEIESRFAISNGFLGVRAARAISRGPMWLSWSDTLSWASWPRTYVAGLFDTPDIQPPMPALVPGPDWTRIRLLVDGEPLRLKSGQLLEHCRTLDMRSGLLLSHWRQRGRAGHTVHVRTVRLVSLAERALGLQLMQLTVDRPAEITLEAVMEGAGSGLDAVRMEPSLAVWRTAESGKTLAVASAAELQLDGRTLPPVTVNELRSLWKWQALPGQSAIFRRFAAFARGDSVQDLGEIVRSTVDRAQRSGWRGVLEAHEAAWAERWVYSDIAIEGDEEAHKALRFAAYHLIAAANPEDERVSIGARALTGDSNLGHVSWDTEVSLLPFYILTWPEAARALLMYRYHVLPGARAKAASMGYRGAMYPYKSADTGDEAAPEFIDLNGSRIKESYGKQEQHISADVAYAVWQYWQATGDDQFLLDGGAEILLDTARFWASRAKPEDDGQYHIRGVIGPDEYHEHIDDNAYTNVLARWNIERGLEVWGMLGERWPQGAQRLKAKLDLSAAEMDEWSEVAAKLKILFDPKTNLFEQFEGFFGLEYIDVSLFKGRTVPMDVILGRERTQASQVAKQADIVALLALLPHDFNRDAHVANFEYYEPRCSQDNGLSRGIHALVAARLGRLEMAMRHFRETAAIDLADINRGSAGGVQIASLGALWQVAIFGFAGLRLRDDGLEFDPNLPREWRSLTFRLQWRGRKLKVCLDADGLQAKLEDGEPIMLRVGARIYELRRGAFLGSESQPRAKVNAVKARRAPNRFV